MKQPRTLSILNGRLIDPANRVDAQLDLHIADGKVIAVGDAPAEFEAEQQIDAGGQIICPGLVDLSARCREPGQEQIATIASEGLAAARGGITTLCIPPDTDPVIDTPAVVELIRHRTELSGRTRTLPIGSLTQGLAGEQLSEMANLKTAGCIALSNGMNPFGSTLIERRALEYAATFGITVFLHPEDHALSNQGCAHEGAVASRLGLPGIPEAAETVAIARDLALTAQTGCRVHFRGLSTGAAARMIRRARYDQLPITADVAAHQLHLTDAELEGFDSNCHVIPPLRTPEDRDSLRAGIADGTIGAICSDHQPHEPDAKSAPFPSTAAGISALETLLPLTLRLTEEKVLSLSDAIARVTCGPADILGLPLGRLNVGADADICIFDPERQWQLQADQMLSSGHNSPFLGWEFSGQVTHTLLQGTLVYTEAQE